MFIPGQEIAPVDWSNVVEHGGTTDKLKALQQYLGVEPTGMPDDATRTALKAFQQSVGLESTGTLDSATMDAIKSSFGVQLSRWDWAIIYAFEYKWYLLLGLGAVGGIGYWLWQSRRKK